MIVDPDFLTHWKTQALIEALSDPVAPLYVIALWAHCHQRRTDRFEGISFATFAKICRFPHKDKAPAFFEAMKECGFVETEGETIIAHGWLEANAVLVARWKGGRATQRRWSDKAEPIADPKGKPIAEPKLSQGDRIGEDRIGVEKSTSTKVDVGPRKAKPGSEQAVIDFCDSLQIPRSDAEYFWDKWNGNGFKNNKQAMRDWQAVIRSWKSAGYLPSQKHATHQRNNPQGSNRNAGTANEGKSSQYAGVGRS